MDEDALSGELLPGPGASRSELVECLQVLHAKAGKPSLRTLERWAAKNSAHALARTTVSEMLSGKRMPSQIVLLTFVQACGIPAGELAPWRQAWERVALAENSRGNSVARLEHLRRQVSETEESLSKVIAGAERAALESHAQLQQSLWRLESLISEHQDRTLKMDEKREESERSFIATLQHGMRQLEEKHRESERVIEGKMQSIGRMLSAFEDRMDQAFKEMERAPAFPRPRMPAMPPLPYVGGGRSFMYEESNVWGDDEDLSPPVIG
jgi:hypothetical protein